MTCLGCGAPLVVNTADPFLLCTSCQNDARAKTQKVLADKRAAGKKKGKALSHSAFFVMGPQLRKANKR